MSTNVTKKATGSTVKVSQLGVAKISEMFALMSEYFENLDREQFESDLSQKDDVVLIHAGSELVGFSTLQLQPEVIDGRNVLVLFSGDTVVHPEHWGSRELQRCFGTAALRAMEQNDTPLYWFLICSGYRTYRYLPLFFREFWPRHDRSTPAAPQALMDRLARRRFNGSYRKGVIIDANGRLREHVSPIEARHLNNPHVAFFQAANPGHQAGDELVCLAQVTPENLTRAALRMTRDGR